MANYRWRCYIKKKKNVLSDLILNVLERTHTVRLEAEHRVVQLWVLEPAAPRDTPKVRSLAGLTQRL